jgi:hypothetical protein
MRDTAEIGRPAMPSAGPGGGGANMASNGSHRLAVRALLGRWRAAERRLAQARPGTAEWNRARLEFDDARAAYQREMDQPRT